jgi:hypothetical protein
LAVDKISEIQSRIKNSATVEIFCFETPVKLLVEKIHDHCDYASKENSIKLF